MANEGKGRWTAVRKYAYVDRIAGVFSPFKSPEVVALLLLGLLLFTTVVLGNAIGLW
ncbi:hypothetical protein [Natrinema salifodinae]|uniref:hypothetical protein n=1 Tax=Natrinema salifodinae TaxID=1202768 RepID=UPI001364C6A2|nr:hypothetical protein [Natrinema salifodinae]